MPGNWVASRGESAVKNIDTAASVSADDQQPDSKLPWAAPVVTEFSVAEATLATVVQGIAFDGATYS